VIRLPVHVQEKVFRLRKAIRVLRRFNGDRNPRVKELANELHWPPEQIQFLLDVSRVVTSLDASINDEDHTLLDIVADDHPGPADLAIAEEEQERILEILGSLTPQQRDVIVKRFGLDRVNERTLEEIGQIYGVTRERIRQIETKALKKLRHPTRTPLLRALLDGSEIECEQGGQDREGEGSVSTSAGGEK
jgi:RNA polymerase primary sigma factor